MENKIRVNGMGKRTLAVLTAMVVLGSLAVPALASNVQFKQKKLPVWTDEGLTLNAAGSLSGLGNEDLSILLTAKADPIAVCKNPGTKQTEAPGQQPPEVTVTGSEAIPASEIKNGNVDFSVTTQAPVSPIPATLSDGSPNPEFTCPNSNWEEDITDMQFTSAVLTIQQPPGTTVLTESVTFSPPTSNGVVPTSDITPTVS